MIAESTTGEPTAGGRSGPARSSPVRRAAVGLLPAAGAGAALGALAARLEGAAAAETATATWTVSVVLGALALARASPRLLAGGALAVVLASWTLPPGPVSAATLGLALVATAAAATADRPAPPGPLAGAALALAVQALLRPAAWMPADLPGDDPLRLVGLALVAGAGGGLLARRRGAAPALAAIAAGLLLEGWLGPATALTLATLAAAGELTAASSSTARRATAGAVAALGLAGALLLSPPLGLSLSLVVVADRGPRGGLPAVLLAAAALAAALLGAPPGAGPSILARIAWLPLLVPAALLSPTRWSRPLALLAALPAAAGGGGAALAPSVALLALDLPAAGPGRPLQAVWSGTWAGAATLLAAHPWMRRTPAADALELVGLAPGWGGALGVAVATLALAATAGWAARRMRRGEGTVAAATGALLLALAAVVALPRPGTDLLGRPVALDADRPGHAMEAGAPLATSSLVVDSDLSWGVLLRPGQPVAVLHLRAEGGDERELVLRAGHHTGDWAARRPDIAAHHGELDPPSWRSRLAAEGWPASRYRARFELPSTVTLSAVRVERADGLPAEVVLTLRRLEVRP